VKDKKGRTSRSLDNGIPNKIYWTINGCGSRITDKFKKTPQSKAEHGQRHSAAG
jgi:hypothetical protein